MGGIIKPIINAIPTSLIERLGSRYVAGYSLQDGVDLICRLHEKYGYYYSLDILGESAKSVEEARRAVDDYVQLIRLVRPKFDFGNHPHQKPVSLSVKPSAICYAEHKPNGLYVSPQTRLLKGLETIADEAGPIDVTLDSEQAYWKSVTLNAEEIMRKKGYSGFGGVLQGRLYRSHDDLVDLFIKSITLTTGRHPVRQRFCLGIYTEDETVGEMNNDNAKGMLIARVNQASKRDLVYIEVATHDHDVIFHLQRNVLNQMDHSFYEFQFLLGPPNVENDLAPTLKSEGHVVRFYAPIQLRPGEAAPYMRRRLIESPGMIIQGALSLGRKSLANQSRKELRKERELIDTA